MNKQYGGKITEELKQKYAQSKYWDGGRFQNLEYTDTGIRLLSIPILLYKRFFQREGKEPQIKLPLVPFDKEAFLAPSDTMKFIWYGHSALLLRIEGKTILIDPMLGSNASPIAPFATERFSTDTLELIDSFPTIDVLLLTHDHYDHLDYDSMQKLMPKVKNYFVALGTARHLVSWGVDADKIQEFDWWEACDFDGINITYTPTRHFSGRGLTDRFTSLWGGWVLKTKSQNIYFSGDGGYGDHFEEVGKQLGPFDFAFVECGQYNENWKQLHLYPTESVQVATDAKAKKIMPVHWGGFSLAYHHWTEPVEQFVAEANRQGVEWMVPRLGELVTSDYKQPEVLWWQEFE